jgi:hypothetical protein
MDSSSHSSPAPAGLTIAETRMSVAQLIEQRKAIVEVMEKTMTKDIDYGIIPGTPKPTLYKPGSEKILAIFHLGVRPRIEDLSTPDCIRYRVHLEIFHQPTGNTLGEGVGEASSAEAKYQWRAAVCDEEWGRRLTTASARSGRRAYHGAVLRSAGSRRHGGRRQHHPQDGEEAGADRCCTYSDRGERHLRAGPRGPEGSGPRSGRDGHAVFCDSAASSQRSSRSSPARTSPATQQRTGRPAAQEGPRPQPSPPSKGKRFWAIAIQRVNDYKAIRTTSRAFMASAARTTSWRRGTRKPSSGLNPGRFE